MSELSIHSWRFRRDRPNTDPVEPEERGQWRAGLSARGRSAPPLPGVPRHSAAFGRCSETSAEQVPSGSVRPDPHISMPTALHAEAAANQ